MIEDKKIGLKIAENPLEEIWETVRKSTEARIKDMKKTLIVEEAVLEMAENKLKEVSK